MSSNLKVNTILPSAGSNIGLGTNGGNLNVDGGCKVQVGTALTLGHTVGVQFATQNLHSTGFEVNNVNASGIITASQFKGDGSNLTGISAGTSLSGSTNNTVCTVTGANAIQGEANLLFDGGTLALNGRYQRGSATVQDGDAIAGGLNINGTDMDASLIMSVFGNDNDFTRISGSKSRNASVGSHTIVQDNDVLLSLKGFGSDGTNFEEAAQIEMQVDGTPNNNVMPGRIVFKTTTNDGVAERVRIDSSGRIGIGENNPTRDIVIKKSGSVQVSMVGATNQGVYLNFGDTDDDNIGAVYYDNPNDRMIIRANTNNAVQVKSNGNMAINDGDLEIGTSGHGISFAATSDASGMANELLDDYEEGTWTPILTGYTSGNTQTYAAQHGSYTKVGRVVTAHFDVKLSNKGNISGTYVLLQGLPFNHAGSRAGTGSVHFFQHLTSSVSSMALEGGGGISSSFWLLCVNGTQSTQLSYTPDSFISNSTQISGTLVYRVS